MRHQIHITKIVKPPNSISNNITNATADNTNNAINSNGTYSNRKVFYSINKNELNFPSSSSSSSAAAAAAAGGGVTSTSAGGIASSSTAVYYDVNNKILSTVLPIHSYNDDHNVVNGNNIHTDHTNNHNADHLNAHHLNAHHLNANNDNNKGNQIIPGSYLDSEYDSYHQYHQNQHNDNNNLSNMKNDSVLNYAYDQIKSKISVAFQETQSQKLALTSSGVCPLKITFLLLSLQYLSCSFNQFN